MMIKMTQKLMDSILNNITNSFTARAVMVEKEKVNETEIADAWYAIAVEPYADIMKQLPEGFFKCVDGLRFAIDEALGIEGVKLYACMTKDRLAPYSSVASYDYNSYGVTWADIPIDIRHRTKEYKIKKQELEDQRKHLVSNAKELLTKCNTLKDFITAWPTGMDFVPDDVKQKHEAPEVRGRKKGAKEVIEAAPELDALVSLNKLLS